MTSDSSADDPTQRAAFLGALTDSAQRDSHLLAVWLEGSLGRGNADRYSDVDIHVLLPENELAAFRAQAESWLGKIRPLVLFNILFGGQMINAVTTDGLRLDLWPHGGEHFEVDPQVVQVLFEQPGALQAKAGVTTADREAAAQRLLGLIREFWRCITLLPAVLGRRERLVALQGLTVELGLVTEILVIASGTIRDRGVKNLNPFLPENLRDELEALILPGSLTEQALADAHLRLAQLVRREGRKAASTLCFEYPEALEQTALTYAYKELKVLQLSVTA
ncbi:nucleotidyltransferase domain-containing protein [Deinococcus saxicola]|uniref:nucleotidyltransferase domain-containing protein n=1 Tax=Deinococcus saxicola TaxID=249406 RepID=UPI0039F05026